VIVADGDDDGKWNCRLMTVDLTTSAYRKKKDLAVSFFYPFTKLNFLTAFGKKKWVQTAFGKLN
jgi:hypothetical protein